MKRIICKFRGHDLEAVRADSSIIVVPDLGVGMFVVPDPAGTGEACRRCHVVTCFPQPNKPAPKKFDAD